MRQSYFENSFVNMIEQNTPQSIPQDNKPIDLGQGMPLTFDSTQFHVSDRIDKEKSECCNLYCIVQTDELYSAQFSNLRILFCKDCYRLYQIKNCCYFCAQVYSNDDQTFLDGKKWIQCDLGNCGKWMHMDCEGKYGIKNIQQFSKNEDYKYKCPWCRQKKVYNRRNKTEQKIFQKQLQCLIGQENYDGVDESKFEINLSNKPSNNSESHARSSETRIQDEDHSIKRPKFQPIMNKNAFLDELLKKFGGLSAYVSQEETVSDLVKINSIITDRLERNIQLK